MDGGVKVLHSGMNELALFAGVGGGLLGSILLGWRPICAVEKTPYCREVLLRRQRDGVLPLFPIWDDITTFDGRPWRGKVDIVTAGFPCQPWSCAGGRKGAKDERNLWPDTIRVIREVEPERVLLENVPDLVSDDYFGQILGSLAEAGFDARWEIVSAGEVGAPHLRKRIWVYCRANGGGTLRFAAGHREPARPVDAETSLLPGNEMGDANRESGSFISLCQKFGPGSWWDTEPALGRVADGLAHRMDRIRAIGNGQVPAVVREAWMRMGE